ncbi:hypothetical protein SERLA73DRAFT_174375 [Serpula lacrymans var. lacrymans S7.3]|uniref:NAD(P)-binding protein n=2 Tax=Serpula lacrymans var. lacrymans TaxID=341189 RepID=F8PFK3_SERL3|nr:uncharacterized protein SERLADRAFT_444726 [Serpula lacrymans var. lacrymans S7.9]EGO05292.1 hypothetical protein SERLA73DRAFT_174375 [Serpula lacrymans var. lacrymans S7.3]EGO31150.1 hypothetical protein SERLADRAFT_444726 [Serpula lacrymans var. lacrymans S7.9]
MSSYAITGAARGIGYEYVNQLSANSANTVFALVRNKATATKLVELGRSNVYVIQADITDNKTLKAAAAEISKVTGGSLDHLINNAAYAGEEARDRIKYDLDEFPAHMEEDLTRDLSHSFNVNAIAVVHTINIFLPLLRNGNAKKVITISTGLADTDFIVKSETYATSSYSISKAAVNMVVAFYAAKFKSQGFVFLALSPGLVNTALKPPTQEEIAEFSLMLKKFRTLYPDFEGPITPETSVRMQLEVINKITVADTGAFLSHKGSKEWL